MKTEKIVLSFIAVLVGILVTGVAFYIYQSTRTVTPTDLKVTPKNPPTPTLPAPNALSIDSPADQSVSDKKTITISGHSTPDSVIVVNKDDSDTVITPARNGDFNTTTTLDDGQNRIEITAIAPNGDETVVTRTVTFSTETF